MKFRDFSSKLATRLRAGQHFKQQKHDARPTQFSDLEAMVSAMQSQDDAALLRVPREIRDIIFDHLWNDAGLAQHIVFQNGHYSAAKCLTAHSVPDNSLAEESASHGTSRFEDVVLWRRMTSSWGNHWRCEEFSHAGRSEQRQINDAGSSLFLTLLLVCRQM